MSRNGCSFLLIRMERLSSTISPRLSSSSNHRSKFSSSQSRMLQDSCHWAVDLEIYFTLKSPSTTSSHWSQLAAQAKSLSWRSQKKRVKSWKNSIVRSTNRQSMKSKSWIVSCPRSLGATVILPWWKINVMQLWSLDGDLWYKCMYWMTSLIKNRLSLKMGFMWYSSRVNYKMIPIAHPARTIDQGIRARQVMISNNVKC